MTDPAIYRMSRSPTSSMNRPAHSPMGPRTRFLRSPSELTTRDSMISITDPSPAYPPSPVKSENNEPLQPIAEVVVTPPAAASPSSSSFLPGQSPIQTSLSPLQISSPVQKALLKPAPLVSAPTLTFESEPVQWKALPHEAALWTLDKKELQEIVGRAIRMTAPETFIRLLSLENLDTALPAEIDRLTTLKASKQARYRFLVQRRTMTLQALNSSFITPDKAEPDDDNVPTASRLAQQLSEVTADCDKLMAELLVINDQISQISLLTEHHLSSALAVALRKLNKSYAKRTEELVNSRQQAAQIKAELEDAWKEAERVAQELDDLRAKTEEVPLDVESDEEDLDLELEEEEAVIETAEKLNIVSRHASGIPTELFIQGRNSAQMEGLPTITPVSPLPRMSAFGPPPGTIEVALEQTTTTPANQDKDDATSVRSTRSMSVKSVRSGKSLRSLRSPDATRLSLVTAARTRSIRASQSSLRLSKHKITVPPPMPDFPPELIGTRLSARGSSHLPPHVGIRTPHSRRSSMNDILSARPLTPESVARTVTMDDIYVRLQSQLAQASDDEIQEVRRTPPPIPKLAPLRGYTSIPNMWVNGDQSTTRSTAPERFPSIRRPVEKLKSYTKRYSLPFPLFKNKPSPTSNPTSPVTESQSITSSKSAPMRFH